jgi:hypothetical protein
MVQCGECGIELPPEFGVISGQPCPACQSTLRAFHMRAEPGGYRFFGGSLSMIHTRPGLQSAAQADDQGNITLMATGPGPRNEDDALEICARLVRTLNKTDGDWSVPVQSKQDIDGYSTNSASNKLQIQVVRASNDNGLWQAVNEAGSAKIVYTAPTAAREMIDVILKKSRKYPVKQKRQLSLVLDAARTPIHTLQPVIDAFRTQHLQECQEAGFAQVWVVGSQDILVERLDR